MKTKIVYVLVNDDADIYLGQTILSVYSLKKRNPESYAILVTDNHTLECLKDERCVLDKYFSEIVSVNFPECAKNHYKSRFLKTTLPQYVSGDFLYVDTDTIILEDLSSIDDLPNSIGLVLDGHGLNDTQLPLALSILKDCKKSLKLGAPYYNSGILYVKDNSTAKEFFRLWHKRWLELLECGINFDQPSLNSVTLEYVNDISELVPHWNFQIRISHPIISNPKIIHYFYSFNVSNPTILNACFHYLKVTRYDEATLDDIIYPIIDLFFGDYFKKKQPYTFSPYIYSFYFVPSLNKFFDYVLGPILKLYLKCSYIKSRVIAQFRF